MNTPHVVAIDWSGRSGPDQRRFLWLAEAVDGELVRLEGGRTRAELVELLIAEAARDPNLIIGVDFAFSLPRLVPPAAATHTSPAVGAAC